MHTAVFPHNLLTPPVVKASKLTTRLLIRVNGHPVMTLLSRIISNAKSAWHCASEPQICGHVSEWSGPGRSAAAAMHSRNMLSLYRIDASGMICPPPIQRLDNINSQPLAIFDAVPCRIRTTTKARARGTRRHFRVFGRARKSICSRWSSGRVQIRGPLPRIGSELHVRPSQRLASALRVDWVELDNQIRGAWRCTATSRYSLTT